MKKYYYDCTDEEISRELCISRQAVSKSHRKAIDNLKKYLN
jgi:DNA-directed RNA polymerase specialized sigma subunit